MTRHMYHFDFPNKWRCNNATTPSKNGTHSLLCVDELLTKITNWGVRQGTNLIDTYSRIFLVNGEVIMQQQEV